jgi:membrane protein implicated in regulation of membrane protease activity
MEQRLYCDRHAHLANGNKHMQRMTRTRVIFFIVIGLIVLILAFSLLTQLIDVELLTQLFIGATIFGVGIVAVDLLGLLGGGSDAGEGDTASDGGDAGDAGDTGDGADSGEAGDLEAGDTGAGGQAWTPTGDEEGGSGHTKTGQLGTAGNPLLLVLTYLRMFVYFCLGFGPVGWFALAGGRNPTGALALATLTGVAAVFVAQAFFRFQRRVTDSTVRDEELVRQSATVLVALDHTTMGRVRVQLGMSVLEPYARAVHAGDSFRKGDIVRIVEVTDEIVYVE